MDINSVFKTYLKKYITISEEEFKYIIDVSRYRQVKKKSFLLQADQVCDSTCFVLKGCLRLYYSDENGFVHILMFAVENWWISDITSYVYNTPASLYIDAVEDSEVLEIKKNDMDKIYDRIPQMDRIFRILSQNSLANFQQRMVSILSKPALERYLEFREKYGHLDLENRLSQRQIASYIGVTPEFLSSIRKKLVKGSKSYK